LVNIVIQGALTTYTHEVDNLRRKKTYRNKSDLRPDSGFRPKKKNRKKDKKRHMENLKEKFRKSREWKDFRAKMAILFNHRDYITGRKLVKGFNVHHLRTEQDAENYQDISHEEEFIPLNSYCHKMLHYLFIFYQKDPTVMDRLKEILDKMCELAPKHIDHLDDDMEECLSEIEESDGDDTFGQEIVNIPEIERTEKEDARTEENTACEEQV